MRSMILIIILTTMWVIPSQSQGEFIEVSDSLTTSIKYNADAPPVFRDEKTSPICVNQTFISNINNSNYYIFVKNAGETKLTNVTLLDILPTGLIYNNSFTIDPYGYLAPIEEISNRDGTTKQLRWNLGELQTGQAKEIVLQVWRDKSNDRRNDENNVVEVRAQTRNAARCISNISATYWVINITRKEIAYVIEVENTGETKLTDVIINDTLPKEMQYLESDWFDEIESELPLARPSVISYPNDTWISWFLGGLETGAKKKVELNVSCSDGTVVSH